MQADGSSPILLVSDQELERNHGWNGREPTWAPDGSRVAFVWGGPGSLISALDPDGAGTLAFLAAGNDPSWSPDGHWIAYRGDVGPFEPRIAATNVGTGEFYGRSSRKSAHPGPGLTDCRAATGRRDPMKASTRNGSHAAPHRARRRLRRRPAGPAAAGQRSGHQHTGRAHRLGARRRPFVALVSLPAGKLSTLLQVRIHVTTGGTTVLAVPVVDGDSIPHRCRPPRGTCSASSRLTATGRSRRYSPGPVERPPVVVRVSPPGVVPTSR